MRPADAVRANVTEDGLVLLDVDSGRIFTANAIAADIWQNVIVNKTPQPEVVDRLASECGESSSVIAADLSAFLGHLQQQQLIVEE
jgi:hypothetical protein